MENLKNINLIKQKITGLSKGQLFLNPEIDSKFKNNIDLAISRLKKWEPIEYIINNAEFYSLDFYVNSKVLIPRNDTEIMVDKTIETILTYSWITLIDVWTWSSCIPISIIKNTKKINNCYVIDISKNALDVSKKNIIKHNLERQIKQIHWDLIKPFLTSPCHGKNNYSINKNIIITANLPYIKNEDFWNVDKETIEFEPALALYWWKDTWFELYEQLIRECTQLKIINHLNSLTLFIEIWFDQKEYCEKYLKDLNLRFEVFKDNWSIDRCVRIKF